MAVWMLAWQLRVLLAPGLELGPLFSRFAHDGVLVAASAMSLWRGTRPAEFWHAWEARTGDE